MLIKYLDFTTMMSSTPRWPSPCSPLTKVVNGRLKVAPTNVRSRDAIANIAKHAVVVAHAADLVEVVPKEVVLLPSNERLGKEAAV